MKTEKKIKFAIPYIDQPVYFWEQIKDQYQEYIQEVYFPMPWGIIGSGRPVQASKYLFVFLRKIPLPHSVLVNPLILPDSIEKLSPKIIEKIKKLVENYGLAGVTISNLLLAQEIKNHLPNLPITASTLMDICKPNQVKMIEGICGRLVVSSRLVRNIIGLRTLRRAFSGKIRLIVNEACLPNCTFRTQHFFEMGNKRFKYPKSLCDNFLRKYPWMRLTGLWILPQHLYLYSGLYDELKLAGRATLQHPVLYQKVLHSYIHRRNLFPNEIGGGPASVLEPVKITGEFFNKTLKCEQNCHECNLCKDYWDKYSNS